MVWLVVAFWALGVGAIFVLVFRNFGGRVFLFSVLGLVVFIAGVVLQAVLMEYSGYGDFVETASRIGYRILIFAVTALAADIVAMTIYTLRHGQSDNQQGKVIAENRPLSAMSLGYPPLMGRSKRKILGSKSHSVTMESLVDGTATFAERMMVRGIVILFIAFFFIWLGLGLILMKNLLILVLIPVLPGLWVYYNLRDDWEQYRRAKKQFAARGRGGQSSPQRREGHRESLK